MWASPVGNRDNGHPSWWRCWRWCWRRWWCISYSQGIYSKPFFSWNWFTFVLFLISRVFFVFDLVFFSQRVLTVVMVWLFQFGSLMIFSLGENDLVVVSCISFWWYGSLLVFPLFLIDSWSRLKWSLHKKKKLLSKIPRLVEIKRSLSK